MSNSTKKKSTKHTAQQRTLAVYNLMIKRKSPQEIIQFATDQKWGVSDRMVYRYIEKARELLKEVTLKDASESLAIALNALWELYDMAVKEKRIETAQSIIGDIVRFMGLDQPQRVEVTNIDKKVQESDTATLLSIVKNK
jgi:hypothetical protein